jgi:quercetin dioxygenase-like cupin family protein
MVDYHRDPRGSIVVLHVDGHEFLLMYSKAGALRGGHSHTHRQFDLMLTGKIRRTLRSPEGAMVDDAQPTRAGEFVVTEPHVPHLFKFLEDSLILEWLEGPHDAFNDAEMRRKVEEQLKEA